MKNIAGWLDGHETKNDGCMYKKNVWIERNRWMDKTNRWMVGRKTKLLKNRWLDGWIEKQIDRYQNGRLDGQKNMDGWIDKNR